MMADFSSLAQFLFDRYAKDEREATKAIEPFMEGDRTGLGELAVLHPLLIPHVRRWTPARVAAECRAKRRVIVRLQVSARAEGDETYGPATEALSDTLRRMALPYSEHRDYRPEWLV